MAAYTYQAQTVAMPTLLDVIAWLWRWALDMLVALVRATLHQATTQPRHYATGRHRKAEVDDEPVREEDGADEQWPDDLAAMAVQVADDREFGLLCGDLVPPTEPMSLAELRAEWELPPADVPGWLTSWEDELDRTARMAPVPADRTETALTAGARRTGGAA